MPAIDPPIHPYHTNGDLTLNGDLQRTSIQRPASPQSDRFESEEFWRDGLSEEQRFAAAVHGPRTEADQEWEDNVTSAEQEWNDEVDEAAYEGATAYSPTSYPRSLGYDGHVPCVQGAAGAAAAVGIQQLREESRSSIAAALELATIDESAAAIERTVAREIENRRQRYRTVRERMTFGDWTPEEWDQMEFHPRHSHH
jgi:hypothetical protein